MSLPMINSVAKLSEEINGKKTFKLLDLFVDLRRRSDIADYVIMKLLMKEAGNRGIRIAREDIKEVAKRGERIGSIGLIEEFAQENILAARNSGKEEM